MEVNYKYVRIQGRDIIENTLTGREVFSMRMDMIRSKVMDQENADLYMEIDSRFLRKSARARTVQKT